MAETSGICKDQRIGCARSSEAAPPRCGQAQASEIMTTARGEVPSRAHRGGGTAAVPSIAQGIEPFQVMMTAKELPTVEFADCTFVFPH